MKQDMILILDLGSEENPRLAREIRAMGGEAIAVSVDVTNAESVKAAHAEVLERLEAEQALRDSLQMVEAGISFDENMSPTLRETLQRALQQSSEMQQQIEQTDEDEFF